MQFLYDPQVWQDALQISHNTCHVYEFNQSILTWLHLTKFDGIFSFLLQNSLINTSRLAKDVLIVSKAGAQITSEEYTEICCKKIGLVHALQFAIVKNSQIPLEIEQTLQTYYRTVVAKSPGLKDLQTIAKEILKVDANFDEFLTLEANEKTNEKTEKPLENSLGKRGALKVSPYKMWLVPVAEFLSQNGLPFKAIAFPSYVSEQKTFPETLAPTFWMVLHTLAAYIELSDGNDWNREISYEHAEPYFLQTINAWVADTLIEQVAQGKSLVYERTIVPKTRRNFFQQSSLASFKSLANWRMSEGFETLAKKSFLQFLQNLNLFISCSKCSAHYFGNRDYVDVNDSLEYQLALLHCRVTNISDLNLDRAVFQGDDFIASCCLDYRNIARVISNKGKLQQRTKDTPLIIQKTIQIKYNQLLI